MFKFILDVRRQLAHYRDYIVLLNTGMEAAEDKIAQLEADNARLRALVDADNTIQAVDVHHYKRIINRLNERIDEQEAKIAELESEIEYLQDEYGDDDDRWDDGDSVYSYDEFYLRQSKRGRAYVERQTVECLECGDSHLAYTKRITFGDLPDRYRAIAIEYARAGAWDADLTDEFMNADEQEAKACGSPSDV